MRKTIIAAIFIAALTLTTGTAWGSPIACPVTTSLDTYLAAGYACDLGGDIFSDFTYASSSQGGALAVAADGVTVIAVTDPISGVGFEFSANWSAGPGQLTDSNIGFMVSVDQGPMYITDAGIAQLAGGVFGDGLATVVEQGCSPAPCLPTTWSQLTFNNGSPTSQLSSDVLFAPTGSVQVSKDIGVSGGVAGIAALSSVGDFFLPTPEPATFVLCGIALIALSAGWRRKYKT